MKKSLDTFRQALRGKDCKVCALPEAVKKQLRGRSHDSAPLPTVLAWLEAEWDTKITRKEWEAHWRGRHPDSVASKR